MKELIKENNEKHHIEIFPHKMPSVNISDIDLNNSFFHFTTRDNLEKVEIEELKAQIGGASELKDEEKARVYMSKGGKGILEIKNSFIYEFKKLKICDIPEEYRKYFDIEDFTSQEIVQEKDVYSAMEKRFKDEVYLKVNAVNGEDFIPEDFLPEELTNEINYSNNIRDIKGKANHDITPDKLSLIETDKGDSTLDVLEYLYNRLMDNARQNGKEKSVKWALSDLDGMFNYIKEEKRNAILNKLRNKETLEPRELLELKDNPLTKVEAFSIVENNPKRIEEYAKFSDLQEKANKGELSPEELKFLTDTAFVIDSEESKKVYDEMIKKGKVKFSEQEIGSATVNESKENKDKAYDKVRKKIYERTHPEQIHQHTNGGQGETEDGR